MPIYEFTCITCKHTASKLRKTGDDTPIKCSKCGSVAVKVWSRTGPPIIK